MELFFVLAKILSSEYQRSARAWSRAGFWRSFTAQSGSEPDCNV